MSAPSDSIREARRRGDFRRELAEKNGWYHSFELPDGTRIEGYNKLEVLRERYSRFPIPHDLRGMRVLDIGAWDGWFSFEAERRGAEVTAVDRVDVPNFHAIHRKLSSKASYRILDVYELPAAGLGAFDIVFFLGILYHLKHPLLALEIVCGLTTEVAIVESFVTDADTWREHQDDIPAMEFYETNELGEQFDNWVGPTVGCLMALCRAAGFARVELLHAGNSHAGVACHRRWEPVPTQAAGPPPELLAVMNTCNFGINFSTRRDEYITCWFRTGRPRVAREHIRFEVDGFGVPAVHARREQEDVWLTNFRLPPGLSSGWKAVRLRLADTDFGASLRIAVDLPLEVERLEIKAVSDGTSWTRGEVRAGGFLTCWVQGLPENCDRANVRLAIGYRLLRAEWIGEPGPDGYRQINAAVPADIGLGEHPFHVECGGVWSGVVTVRVL